MIEFYSVWPAFACTVAILAVLSTPVFALLDEPLAAHPRAPRVRSIDGLRGLLALAVVFHHTALVHGFFSPSGVEGGRWGSPPTRFYTLVGPVGVSMFFMITGYLFWSRLLDHGGRLDWVSLYIGRIFRIGPLYLFAIGLAMVVNHSLGSGLPLADGVAPISAVKTLSSLCLLGLVVYPDINGILLGVTWTIQYEWLFYLSLPYLAILLRLRRFQTSVVAALLVCCLVFRIAHSHVSVGVRTPAMLAALFFSGMLSACLQKREREHLLPDWLSSLLAILLIGSVFFFNEAYTPGPLLLLGGAFYLIASGCTIFGLLTSRSAIRLGDVSYGIYLLQGLVLAAVFRPAACRAFAWSSPWRYWSMSAAALLGLVLFATATFAMIERPGIGIGRRITRSFRSRYDTAAV